MTGYMEFLIWIGGMIAASVVIDRLAPMLPEGRIRDRLKNAGAVVLFGYVLMLLTVLMIADYYLGYSLGDDARMVQVDLLLRRNAAAVPALADQRHRDVRDRGVRLQAAGAEGGTQWSRKMFRQMPLTASFGSDDPVYAIRPSLLILSRRTDRPISLIRLTLPGGDPDLGGDPNHLLGTDQIGRDILSRLIYGAQNTVGIAFATTCLAFFIGTTFGFLAATLGGWFDQLVSRFVDMLMAIPQLIFALLLMTIATAWAGSGAITADIYMVVIIAVLDLTACSVFRAVGMNIVVMDFFRRPNCAVKILPIWSLRKFCPTPMRPCFPSSAAVLFCLPDNCRTFLPRDWYPAAIG